MNRSLLSNRIYLHQFAIAILFTALYLGCGKPDATTSKSNDDSNSSDQSAAHSNTGDSKTNSPTQKKQATTTPKRKKKSASKIVKKSFSSADTDGSFSAAKSFDGKPKVNLVKAIWDYGLESQLSNPTVVVWLFDVSQSATALRSKVVSGIRSTPKVSDGQMFESMVVTYSDGPISLVSEEPTKDFVKLSEQLTSIEASTTEGEKTFAALNETAKKFGPLRRIDRKSLIVVLVTDEAGDDSQEATDNGNTQLEDAIANFKKFSMPLFVIGNPAPFGRAVDAPEATTKNLTYGPESVYSERINIGTWDGSTELDRFDSGFGPWGLERLCRQSGGRYLADRPEARSARLVSRMQSNWPIVMSQQFKDSIMSRYKPFYGTHDDYKSDLQSNKAKLALHNAAKRPNTQVYRIQNYEFGAGNEAQLVREINSAQRTPAVIRPGLEKLYGILKEGESDRENLKSKRWQAGYDLAYGRVLANYIRVVVLNTMLAEMKGGKTFSNPANNRWVLEPSDEVSTGSGDKRLAEKAKMYLTRVTAEHPGTPWAKIAEKELERPLGWKWTEAQR